LDEMFSFDLFHGFFLHLAFLCLGVARRRGGRPVIASIRSHEADLLNEPGYRHVATATLRRADWVTYLSPDSAALFRELHDFSGKSCFVPNAVSADRSPEWSLTLDNRGVLGTVSSFEPRRRLPMLIDAYALLPRSLRRGLVLVGDESDPRATGEAVAVRHAIHRHGLDAEVELTGFVTGNEVFRRLLKMNVYALPSVREGLPNALLEAAVCGVPIVATAVGGVGEVFRHGESALLVPPEDCARTAAAIRTVLEDPRLARSLSRGAHAVAKSLSPERESQAWLELYTRLVSRRAETITGSGLQ